ncbi:hypothetical protein KKG36_00725 [Patescibacteria group bacterium]|nr:hypothetical protein [Patescibacteria group bacterium]
MVNIYIFSWLSWHFLEVPVFLLGVWKNYILCSANFFSTPLLLSTLFAPWRRYKWNYATSGFNIGMVFETLLSNLISRILGAVVRLALIVIGVFFQLIVLIAGFLIILLWFFLPLICLAGFLISMGLI